MNRPAASAILTDRVSHPGHGVDAALAAVATLSAAWPISTLLSEPTWLAGAVLLLAVVALSGVGARALALRGWLVLLTQFICLVLAASAIYGQGHLWHGLPTFETLGLADRLVRESVATAQAYAAPAPSTPGLIFVVGCALGLVALAVDYLAVTRGSPSLAGLPLLTAFLASASNSGSSLPVRFFLVAAGMWLILIARAGRGLVRGWGTAPTVARTPAPASPDSRGSSEYATMARTLGAVALVAAIAVPVALPQSAPKYLATGLGRSSSPESAGSDAVGFSLSLDLAADLQNPSQAPVLEYTTSDPSPPPLRVTISSFYRPERGVWLPWGRPLPTLSTNADVPEPAGLSPEVPRKSFVTTFTRNLLGDPYLATPHPLVDAELAGVEWGVDAESQNVRVAERPDSYATSYWRLEPTATMLESSPTLGEGDRSSFDLDMTLEEPYAAGVTTLAEQLTAGKASAYDKAMAIQQYLRADGGFTYSLTLAPPTQNASGVDAGFDPLTNFLATKQGYCVQFATAMVMMSRAAGIPARMTLGFLPGTETRGVWTVLAADAHAWPELYLDGIGWTRFEPTPSRGTPPVYAQLAPSGTAPDGSPLDETTAPAPLSSERPDVDPASPGNADTEVALTPASILRWLTHGWGAVLLGTLIGLLGSLVVPAAARWRRRRSLAEARTPAQRVDVQWELLTSSLGDLGIPPAPSSTPRQLYPYYEREAFLQGAASQALGRVVQTLERSRYAADPPPPNGLAADIRHVYRAAAANRGGRERLRAALWPSDGVTALYSARAQLAWRIRAPLRRMGDATRRRLARNRRTPR